MIAHAARTFEFAHRPRAAGRRSRQPSQGGGGNHTVTGPTATVSRRGTAATYGLTQVQRIVSSRVGGHGSFGISRFTYSSPEPPYGSAKRVPWIRAVPDRPDSLTSRTR